MKQKQLFYRLKARAKYLSPDYKNQLEHMKQYLLQNEKDFVLINIYLELACDDLLQAMQEGKDSKLVFGTHFSNYITTLKKRHDMKELVQKAKQNDEGYYLISSVWFTICTSIVMMSFKRLCLQQFYINLNIDILVMSIMLFFAIINLKQKIQIVNHWNLSHRIWMVEIVSVICCVIMTLLTLQSPFDFNFVLLVTAHFISKKWLKEELKNA